MEDTADLRDTRQAAKKKNASKLNVVQMKAKANVLDKKNQQREQQKKAEIEKIIAPQIGLSDGMVHLLYENQPDIAVQPAPWYCSPMQ